ncbi:MAG: TonB-dependent receptor plug domain-containing protein [Burkholderiales bacterium]
MKPITRIMGGVFSLLLSTHSLAQDATPEVEAPAVEVSAFRVPTLVTEAAQGVSVVTSREIQERNPASVAQVLQMVPGVQVDRMGGAGGLSSIYIRGSDPEHVLVLVDGVRMNDPLLSRGGAYDLSAIDPASIERIEVIRGTGSTMYGADAIGGVVNIITRRGSKEGLSLSGGLGVGTKGYSSGNARVAGGNEQVQYSVGAAVLKDGRNSDGGELDLTTFDGAVSLQAMPGTHVKFFARHNERESTTFPEASGGIRLASNRTLEQRDATETTFGANAIYAPSDQWSARIQISRYDRAEDINSPGVGFSIPATISTTEFVRDSFLASGSLKLPLNSELSAGYEYQNEDGDSRSVLTGLGQADFQLKRHTNALFAAWKGKPIENLIVLADLRYDRISNLSSETSPGAAVRYNLASGTSLKARYSEGFRPPSFYSLASPLVGNANLVSETSRSMELGAEQVIGEYAQLGASVFKTRTKNLIDFDSTVSGPIGFGQIVNRDTVESEGIEVQGTARPIAGLNVGASYTYVSTDILNSASNLRNRPKHRASVSVNYEVDQASRVSLNTVYVSKSFDFSDPTGEVQVDSYFRTDIGYSYRWKQFTASAAIDNVFDEKYEEFVGFTNPGRRFRVSVSAAF